MIDKKDYKEIKTLYKMVVKTLDKIVIGIGIVGIVFLLSFFFNNYTGASIGLVILGGAITLKVMIDAKKHSKALWYMWIAILILVLFLLGLGNIIPKINFG